MHLEKLLLHYLNLDVQNRFQANVHYLTILALMGEVPPYKKDPLFHHEEFFLLLLYPLKKVEEHSLPLQQQHPNFRLLNSDGLVTNIALFLQEDSLDILYILMTKEEYRNYEVYYYLTKKPL